jgi:hypothetical protein
MKRLKVKRHNTEGKRVNGLPFMGEVMVCAMCHEKKKSDPKIESGWTMLQIDNTSVYLCPQCFSNYLSEGLS